jgi:CRP-like cAMP-binding protein
MVRKDPDKEHVVREFGAGDFLGRLSLFGKSNRLFSLIATSDTACLVVPREKFAKAMAQFPELMPKVLQSLVEKIHMWEKRRMIDYPDIYDKPCGHIGVSLL